MDAPVLAIENLSCPFGARAALREIDLVLHRGEQCLVVGGTGSGKTTLARCIVGLRRTWAGKITVFGESSRDLSLRGRHRLAYLPESATLIDELRVDQLLRFTAAFYPSWDYALARELLHRFAIDPRDRCGALALEAQRQIGLVLCLAPHPDLLVLDEPARELDSTARRDLLETLVEHVRSEQLTLLHTTAMIEDASIVAGDIAILHQGRIRLRGPPDRLQREAKEILITRPGEGELPEIPALIQAWRKEHVIHLTVARADGELLATLAEKTKGTVTMRDLSLAELYRACTRRRPQERQDVRV
ncbi:MAG: ABC transporter ATP-binding protein [Planctomycetota bacterium]